MLQQPYYICSTSISSGDLTLLEGFSFQGNLSRVAILGEKNAKNKTLLKNCTRSLVRSSSATSSQVFCRLWMNELMDGVTDKYYKNK